MSTILGTIQSQRKMITEGGKEGGREFAAAGHAGLASLPHARSPERRTPRWSPVRSLGVAVGAPLPLPTPSLALLLPSAWFLSCSGFPPRAARRCGRELIRAVGPRLLAWGTGGLASVNRPWPESLVVSLLYAAD